MLLIFPQLSLVKGIESFKYKLVRAIDICSNQKFDGPREWLNMKSAKINPRE